MAKHDNSYFINLKMKLSQKDQETYNQWAFWCAQSNDKYSIDGKLVDGEIEFFTKVRSEDEIDFMHRKDEFMHQIDELGLNPEDEIDLKYIQLVERFLESNDFKKGAKMIPYERFREIEEAKRKSKEESK